MAVKEIRASLEEDIVTAKARLVIEARAIRELLEELGKEALPLLGETRLFGGERLRPTVASIAQTCSSYAVALEEGVQIFDGLRSYEDMVFLTSLSYFAKHVSPKLTGEASYPATLRRASEELERGIYTTKTEFAGLPPPESKEEERLRAEYKKALEWFSEPRYEPEPYAENLAKIRAAAQTAMAELRQAAIESFSKKTKAAVEAFSKRADAAIAEHTADVQREEDLAELYRMIKETEETAVPLPSLPAQPRYKQREKQESGLGILRRLRRA